MVRDYANHRQKTRGRAKQQTSQSRWVITIGLGIIFVAGLSALKRHELVLNKQKHTHNQAQTVKSPAKPEFDFYTMLPKMQVWTPPENEQENKNDHQLTQTTAKQKYQYMLQVAAFTRYQDADRLRAGLILQGFNVKIITAANSKNVWHRVLIGPYQHQQAVIDAQAALLKIHLQGLMVKIG